MADAGIKKSSIFLADLPAINPELEGYDVRYRIVSEDKNRVSHWSPIQTVKPELNYVSGNIACSTVSDISTVAWTAVGIYKNGNLLRTATEYDIWVKWDKSDGGDWLYRSRVSGTGVTLLVPQTYTKNGILQSTKPNKLTVEVYLKGDPITRDTTFLRVYNPTPYNV
jgi:hypothetical protein